MSHPAASAAGSSRARAWGACWRRCSARWGRLAPRLARATGWRVWNPGRYGEPWHARFRALYPPEPHPIVVFGLNPGPYGMAQTGIPFTDVRRVLSDLPRLAAQLARSGSPPVAPGLAPADLRPWLTRTFESSAVRVHLFLRSTYGSTEDGVRRVVVANPCSLLFIDPNGGANRTPADLGRVLRRRAPGQADLLLAACERARRACALDALQTLEPRGAVLLGRDVQAALVTDLESRLGAARVVAWEHPARAVPRTWAAGLRDALDHRGLLEAAPAAPPEKRPWAAISPAI